jgi:MFS family permease
MRLFSGYLIDSFPRKPLYLAGFIVFALIFAGYTWAGSLLLMVVLRMLHGLAFGLVTVGGNTIVIDITPSTRRGEAVGYYGLMNNLSLCLGPMTGLFMNQAGMSYDSIFYCALLAGALGIAVASFVHTPYKPPLRRDPLSFDRFILFKGLPAGLSLLLLAIPYGMTSTYIALYAKEIGIHHSTGLFFTCMAIGLGTSRFFSGKEADRGRGLRIIQIGMVLTLVVFFLMASLVQLQTLMPSLVEGTFFAAAVGMGLAYGSMFPAFNNLFVSLAPNTKRGTAISTYLTSWDVGISLGLLTGGWILAHYSFARAYLLGFVLTLLSFLFFWWYVVSHYHRHKQH